MKKRLKTCSNWFMERSVFLMGILFRYWEWSRGGRYPLNDCGDHWSGILSIVVLNSMSLMRSRQDS